MNEELINLAVNDPTVVSQIMSSAPLTIVIDFGLISLLLVIAKIIRSKVKFFQDFFIPSSIIAGFIGLILGPQFLNIMPFSTVMGKYAWLLVVMLFATFPIGQKKSESKKEILNKTGSTFFYNLLAEVAQFAIFSLLGITVMKFIWPDLHEGFALLFPAGFAGGHGYATAIGSTLEQYGFENAITVGMTMATLGLLAAIFGGIVLIKHASNKGYTRIVKESNELPKDLKVGLIPKEKREPIGHQTVSPMSIDPIAWHLALILAATLLGIYLTQYLGTLEFLNIGGKSLYMPEVCTAMVASILIQKVIHMVKLDNYVDKPTVSRIGSCLSDYMVAFGIASIEISVVIEFWQPMLFTIVIGMLWILFMLYYLGPRMLNNYWFERAIFTYGWSTGVVAFGVTLLRIVDPDYVSEALEDYGLAYILISPVELVIVSLCPVFFMTNGVVTTSVLIIASLAIVIVAKKLKFWYTKDKLVKRDGEIKSTNM